MYSFVLFVFIAIFKCRCTVWGLIVAGIKNTSRSTIGVSNESILNNFVFFVRFDCHDVVDGLWWNEGVKSFALVDSNTACVASRCV